MNHATNAYGLWSLVLINSAIFIFFAFSFFKPQTSRDWRTFGAFSAFIVALFVEMYGFPLTIYLLMPWLARNFPGIDFLSHDAGHLLETLMGWKVNPHWGPFHIFSNLLIAGDGDDTVNGGAGVDGARSYGLAISQDVADVEFRFHPALAPFADLYDAGDLSMIHACGLTEATRSHFDAEARMERGLIGANTCFS